MNPAFSQLPAEAGTLLLAAGFFRYLGMMASFPFPDGLLHPGSRLGIALAMTLTQFESGMQVMEPQFLYSDAAMDFILGLLGGVPLLVIHCGAKMWGDLFESLRGHQVGLVIDPMSGGEEPPMALLVSQLTFAALLSRTTLPLLFVSALRMPAGVFGPITLERLAEVASASLLSTITVLQSFFLLLVPYLLIVIVIEVILGLLSRIVSGLSLSSEGYLLRLALTFLFLSYEAESLTLSFVSLLAPAA